MTNSAVDITIEMFDDPAFTVEIQMLKAIEILKLKPLRRDSKLIHLLCKVMQNVTFFRNVSLEYGEETLFKICKHITYETKPVSGIVFKQGERGQEFFILLKGLVSVNITLQRTVEKQDGTSEKEFYLNEVAEKVTGDSFGELALIEDKPRTATIICKEECHFAILDRANYKEILANAQQKKIEEQVQFLMSFPLFGGASRRVVSTFIYHFNEKRFLMNEWVYKEGDDPQHIYFVKEGEFKVTKEVDAQDFIKVEESDLRLLKKRIQKKILQIGSLGRGQIIGIEDVVNRRKRAESVQCVTNNSLVYYIKKQDFEKRFIGATNDDVVKNVRNYVNTREDWHEKRQNSIKATSQLNSEFMLSTVLLNNKRSESRQLSYSTMMTATDQDERRSPLPDTTDRIISPLETPGQLVTEPLLTLATERRAGKLIISEGPVITEQTSYSRKHHYTEEYQQKDSSPIKATYKKGIETKRNSMASAFYTDVYLTDRHDLPEHSPTKQPRHYLSHDRHAHHPKTPSPSFSKDVMIKSELQNNSSEANEVSFRARPNTPTRLRVHSKESFLNKGGDNLYSNKMEPSLFGRKGSQQPVGIQRKKSDPLGPNNSFKQLSHVDELDNGFYQKEAAKHNNIFEFKNMMGISEPQKPKQFLQKNAINSVKMRSRSLNSKRLPDLDKSQNTNQDSSKNPDREYLSFKTPLAQESLLSRIEEQRLALEAMAQIATQMENKTKSKELNIFNMLKNQGARVFKRNPEDVHTNSHFKGKHGESGVENLTNPKSRLVLLGGDLMPEDASPNHFTGSKHLSKSKPGNERFIDLSTLIRRQQISQQQDFVEVGEKIYYPIKGVKQAKPPMEATKQIRAVRKLRRLMSKDLKNNDLSRIHSFKPQ